MVRPRVVCGTPASPPTVRELRRHTASGENKSMLGNRVDYSAVVVKSGVAKGGWRPDSVLHAADLDMGQLTWQFLDRDGGQVRVGLCVIAYLEALVVQNAHFVPR